jgi:hypothetical protein
VKVKIALPRVVRSTEVMTVLHVSRASGQPTKQLHVAAALASTSAGSGYFPVSD